MHKPRETRRNVLVRARMQADGPPMDVCIRNVSSRGLLVHASAAPARGTYIELLSADQRIVGRVIWGKGRRFGVRTHERVDVLALIGAASGATPAGGAASARLPRRPGARAPATRPRARAFELAVVALFAASTVAALGATAYKTLATPFATIAALLGR